MFSYIDPSADNATAEQGTEEEIIPMKQAEVRENSYLEEKLTDLGIDSGNTLSFIMTDGYISNWSISSNGLISLAIIRFRY